MSLGPRNRRPSENNIMKKRDENDNSNKIYFRIPFVDEAQASQTRRILRNISSKEYRIMPTFITNRPLAMMMRKGAKLECYKPCICDGQKLIPTKECGI